MGELAARLVAIAKREVGVREEGPNSGPRVIDYQKATWLPPGSWPWCAAFVDWCVREWLEGMNGAEIGRVLGPNPFVNKAYFGPIEGWRPHSALAYDFEKWGEERRLRVLDETQTAMPGDIVTFDFPHCGIVVVDAGDQIVTVEGNTNEQGSKEGDGVYTRRRARSLIRKLIRITDL